MSLTVIFEGAAELAAALLELPRRATEKSVVTRGLKASAEPTRDLAAALAPYAAADQGLHLRDAVIISTKTVSRQRLENARPGDVTVYIGPDKRLRQHHGIQMEFGTFKDRAQPFMRPAWAATKDQAFDQLGLFLWQQIDITAHRIAVRSAKSGS